MSTPTQRTAVDLRPPDEDTAKAATNAATNAATKHSSEVAGAPLDEVTWPVRTDRLTLRPAT